MKWILMIIIGVLISAYIRSGKKGKGKFLHSPRTKKPSVVQYRKNAKYQETYDRLLRMTHGDRFKAQRLIAHETSRDPTLSNSDAIKRAIERWEYDLTR